MWADVIPLIRNVSEVRAALVVIASLFHLSFASPLGDAVAISGAPHGGPSRGLFGYCVSAATRSAMRRARSASALCWSASCAIAAAFSRLLLFCSACCSANSCRSARALLKAETD